MSNTQYPRNKDRRGCRATPGSTRDSRVVNGDPPFTRSKIDPAGGSPTSTRGSRALPGKPCVPEHRIP